MTRRGRAIGFASAAAVCAGLAAGTGGGTADDAARYGELRDVVAAVQTLPAGRSLGRTAVGDALEVRRVPERFVATDALTSPAQAVGRRPIATIPAGGYLVASQFREPDAPRAERPVVARDRTPVELAVQGAAPLAGRSEARVDVVVTREAGATTSAGRTYVAAREVVLLDLRPAGAEADQTALPGPASESWIATLALTHGQALRLIHAQSFARELRLINPS